MATWWPDQKWPPGGHFSAKMATWWPFGPKMKITFATHSERCLVEERYVFGLSTMGCVDLRAPSSLRPLLRAVGWAGVLCGVSFCIVFASKRLTNRSNRSNSHWRNSCPYRTILSPCPHAQQSTSQNIIRARMRNTQPSCQQGSPAITAPPWGAVSLIHCRRDGQLKSRLIHCRRDGQL